MAPTPEPADYSITMWGAPATGKTTFLAALSIALIRFGSVWCVNGADEASTDMLIRLTTGLATDRCFPPGDARDRALPMGARRQAYAQGPAPLARLTTGRAGCQDPAEPG